MPSTRDGGRRADDGRVGPEAMNRGAGMRIVDESFVLERVSATSLA